MASTTRCGAPVAAGGFAASSERASRSESLLKALHGAVLCAALFHQFLEHFGHVGQATTQERSGLRERGVIGAGGGQRAIAANKFEAPGIAAPLEFSREQQSGLPGAGEVRATAGLAVETFHFDGSQDAFAVHFLANAGFFQFLSGAEGDDHGAILENNFVGAALGLFDMARNNGGRVEIDSGDFPAQMKRNGWEIEQFDKGGGEQVLAGVLLHVVDAARPVDFGVNGTKIHFRGGVVDHFFFGVGHFHNRSAVQRAQVVRLAAGSWDRRRCGRGELSSACPLARRRDLRVEFAEERITVVKAFGQGGSTGRGFCACTPLHGSDA